MAATPMPDPAEERTHRPPPCHEVPSGAPVTGRLYVARSMPGRPTNGQGDGP